MSIGLADAFNLALVRCGVSEEAVRKTIKAGRRIAHRRDYLAARQVAAELPETEWTRFLSWDAGCRTFKADEIPGLREVADVGRQIVAQRRDAAVADNPVKPYQINLFDHASTTCPLHEVVWRFALSRPMLEIATGYLGQVPVLHRPAVWVTLPNNTAEGSQLYHFDYIDTEQAKFIILLNDVDEATGPFTLVPANGSRNVADAVGFSMRRYQDDEVYKVTGESAALRVTGGPGDGGVVDTSRCLHYGARSAHKERNVLVIQYYTNTPIRRPARVRAAIRDRFAEDALQKMVLRHCK